MNDRLYDPSKPVLLHEDIEDGDTATSEVPTELGHTLYDAVRALLASPTSI